MSDFNLNNRRVRSWVYGVITLCSLVVFGNVAEVCDTFNSCPVRLRGIITIGVLGTIFSLVVCLALLCDIEPIIKLELIFVVILFVLYSICVGVVSSVRTGTGVGSIVTIGGVVDNGVPIVNIGGLGNIIAVTFAWIAEVLVCVALFMVLTSSDGPCPLGAKSQTTREKMEDIEKGITDVETPEEEYMKQVGSPKTDSGPDSDQSPNGIVEDSKEVDDKNNGNANYSVFSGDNDFRDQ
ncbi:hypothetical protein FGB62_116g027 [Gracilaria domingensis]|nr:hypothetical protein FGB62_116g027 [Gracilaria domingensis]